MDDICRNTRNTIESDINRSYMDRNACTDVKQAAWGGGGVSVRQLDIYSVSDGIQHSLLVLSESFSITIVFMNTKSPKD